MLANRGCFMYNHHSKNAQLDWRFMRINPVEVMKWEKLLSSAPAAYPM